MAIYHCNVSNVSRGKGSSSCATLSYITGEKVKDERLDTTFDYGRKERVLMTGTMLPEHAPREYEKASVLFNSIEKYEKSENARTGKKIEIALPREFDLNRQREVVEKFIRENITSKSYACTYAIHTDQENSNPHAHILIANRQINNKGEWSSKRKMEYALDERGERIPQIDKETGLQKVDKQNRKQWKRVNAEVNPLDRKEVLQSIREQWAVECNSHLAEHQQIDHRTLAEQNREQIATVHEGYSARQIEQRGGVSERCEYNREVSKMNEEHRAVTMELADTQAFVELLKNTESRLQDLQSTGNEQSYNFAYDTVVSTIERDRKFPVLQAHGNQTAISSEDTPQKALSILEKTKDKWNDFIRNMRESVRIARKDDLSKSEGKTTTEPKKERTGLLERFKGMYEGIKERQAEKQAEKQRAIEKEREERRRAEKLANELRTARPLQVWQYQERAEQLDYLERLWRERPQDYVLQEALVKKVSEVTGMKINEYDVKTDSYYKRKMSEIPDKEVFGAISREKDRVWEDKAYAEKREIVKQRYLDLIEKNKDKIAEMNREREKTKVQGKGGQER